MHRAHIEMTMRSIGELDAKLLLHPVVGMTKLGDVDHYTRVRCYQHVIEKYPERFCNARLIASRNEDGRPRETLLHGIIRKNYGCTHLIIGRDHAGPGNDSRGNPFYGPMMRKTYLVNIKTKLVSRSCLFNLWYTLQTTTVINL